MNNSKYNDLVNSKRIKYMNEIKNATQQVYCL